MKKRNVILLVLVLSVGLCFSSCSSSEQSPIKYIEKTLSLELSGYELSDKTETHSGFLGDGETYYVIENAQADGDISVQFNDKWHALPMTDELSSVIYGSNNKLYDVVIPRVENGYYCFIDRSRYDENNKKIYDYDNLTPDLYDLYNFTICIYNSDSGTIYYYELDT